MAWNPFWILVTLLVGWCITSLLVAWGLARWFQILRGN